MTEIRNLLQRSLVIQKDFEEIAATTGKNYNVFDILGVNYKELSHSSILNNLLDVKGKHAQKDIFLKLFLTVVEESILEKLTHTHIDGCSNNSLNVKIETIKNFDTINSYSITEKYVGKINDVLEEGGRIDIIINDGEKEIIIENKLYALDQNLQLIRYKNYKKTAPIFYLTLYGNEPSDSSRGNLKSGQDYFCISYKSDIVKWLDLCIKEMVNKPYIRETLNQYLFLINELTGQSNNSKMSEKIGEVALENIDGFLTIMKESTDIWNYIMNKNVKYQLKKLKVNEQDDLQLIEDFEFTSDKYCSFSFSNKKLKSHNVEIKFMFDKSGYENLCYGFYKLTDYENGNRLSLKGKYNELDSTNWAAWAWFEGEFQNWTWTNLKDIIVDEIHKESIEDSRLLITIREKLLLLLNDFNESTKD